ncbi:MAG: hypothetical protein NTV90_00060 [Actinobacteria bacterium]|nr:hypothetical protein [Actinomycetota bacterium]
MSTATFPAGTYNFDRPSGGLTRRGRLAHTLLVLSLSVVLGAGFAMNAGAGDALSTAKINGSSDSVSVDKSYVVVTVASGETLWSLASAMADGGDVQSLVADSSQGCGQKTG